MKKLNLGLLLTLALIAMIGTAYLSYRSYNRTLNNYNWVSHSQEVLRTISEGQATLYETESGIRAYVILQQTQYKPDLIKARATTDSIINYLVLQTKDNTAQQKNISQLPSLIDKRFKIWNSLVADIFSLNLFEQDSLILEGIKTSKSINTIWNAMQVNEYSLLEIRQDKRQSDISSSPLFLLAASLLSSLIVGALFWLLRNSLRESEALRLDVLKKNVELSRSNQDLEQFAYVASHDLQEPLRKMKSFAERLKIKEENLSEEGHDIISKLDGFATKMQRLIDDLLQFSRVVNAKVEGKKVDLNVTLREAKNNLAESISKKNAVIKSIQLPVIVGYESQMLQLFQNLLSNSIKYSRKDVSPVIKITCSIVPSTEVKGLRQGDEGKSFNKIEFTDNGIGFNTQYADKIFVVFQRLHGKGEYDGTGIGLAISKGVVMNHNGYIQAEGEEGKGATFTIYLPIITT